MLSLSVPGNKGFVLKNKLSIIIPTFNRWGVLAKTLENTLANNWAGVPVIILDNDSDPRGQEAVLDVMARYKSVPCQIQKNAVNIGGDGNIIRCVEICETPYVLVLGDDDFLAKDYLEKIAYYLMQDQSWGYISFKDRLVEGIDKIYNSPVNMVEACGDWSELLFISTTIFNKEMFCNGMFYAQRAQITHSAHLVGMMKGWEKSIESGRDWNFVLSTRQLVVSGGHARDHRSFELMSIYAGFPLLEFVFQDRRTHYAVRAAIRGATKRMFKPRVLGKEFFYYTLQFGFEAAWRRMLAMRRGLSYSIGGRALFYRAYLPLVVVFAGGVSAFVR
jgi:glycosyltransferase involved in cell wall biosynthesis